MKRIAIVEDNPDNRLLLEALLAGHFDMDQYESGPEAIAGLRSRPVDCILLDVSLPGMDGLEVVSQLKADPQLKRTPVIAFTAHAMTGDRERFLAAGFDDYFTKPIVDERPLIALIERLTSR